MDVFEFIGGVIGLCCLGFLLFYDEIVPRSPKAFFRKVKEGYRNVEAGEMSFIAYKESIRNECLRKTMKESGLTTRFKEELVGMFNYDDFIKQTLSDSSITIDEFEEKWKMYDSSAPSKSQSVPVVFLHGKGKKIMDNMVEKGYCKSSNLSWIFEGENSSYLLVFFADAIGKELGFGRARWREFVPIWGDKNYSDLFEKAKNCDNRYALEEKVTALFPNYSLPR